MANPKIALQLMTVKEYVREHGIIKTLEQLSRLGLHYVEMSQIPISDQLIEDMRAAEEEYGIKLISYTGIYEKFFKDQVGEIFEDSFEQIVKYAHRLGAPYIRTAMMPRSCLFGNESIVKAARGLNEYGRRFRAEGLKLYYHMHHIEYMKVEGRPLVDYLLENTDPENLGFEIDTHWALRGGQNPLAWMERMASQGRGELLHLKEYCLHVNDPENIQREIFETSVRFGEIGEGNVDFPSVLNTAAELGVKYAVIEQDQTYEKAPLESVALSIKNLKAMGFEANFE